MRPSGRPQAVGDTRNKLSEARSVWEDDVGFTRDDRKVIAKLLANGTITSSQVGEHVVDYARKKHLKGKQEKILMDELAFKAHFKYVRGWPKLSIIAKWDQITSKPWLFETVQQPDRSYKVWVPQDPSVELGQTITSDGDHQDLPDMSEMMGCMSRSSDSADASSSGGPMEMFSMPVVASSLRQTNGEVPCAVLEDSDFEEPSPSPDKSVGVRAASPAGVPSTPRGKAEQGSVRDLSMSSVSAKDSKGDVSRFSCRCHHC